MASRIDKLSNGETSALRQEAISFANQIAKNARLDNPLPTDVDFSPEVFEELQSQLKASAVLPVKARRAIYLAFSAAHLPTLAAGLRALSYETQYKALSSYVQILSLLPDPKENAYLRRFLDQPISDGLPTLIASFFVRGLEYLPPSSRGQICTLIIHTLFWCDGRKGDDKAASIDGQVRSDLAAKLKELMEEDSYKALDRRSIESVELGRLSGMLTQIEHLPGPNGPGDGYFCSSTKEHLLGTIPGQEECDQCMEEEDLQTCSRCKAVKYCSEKCQRKAWKEHKLTCFTVAF